MTPGILAGLRVVEISAFVAAPLAGSTLASLGADVVRVEQIGGGIDAGRWPLHEGRSLYREGLDRGKRSVALDLRSAEGLAIAADLAAAAGTVITNLPPRAPLDYPSLAARRADLVMLVLSGTRSGTAALDYTVNAGVGFPWVTGPVGHDGPVNHVLPAWDVSAGLYSVIALLAADRHRAATGKGQLVEAALTDVAVAVAGHLGFLSEAALEPEPRSRLGNHVFGSYARDFRTADGRHLIVCAFTPRQWTGLVAATGTAVPMGELAARTGADLAEEGARFRHREAISAVIEPWFTGRTLAAAAAALDAAGVLWGPYRTFKELVAAEPDLVTERRASPLRFGALAEGAPPVSPTIGGDTADVLREWLGFDDARLAALRASGFIART